VVEWRVDSEIGWLGRQEFNVCWNLKPSEGRVDAGEDQQTRGPEKDRL
jgi:hypothetical protein